MKLMLRQEWRRPYPLASFLGFLDLKTGVTIALLFAVLNKVAGVYGLIAMLAGAGSSAAQLSLYIYSVLGLVALAWGLKAVQEEDPKRTLYFAHAFFADHILNTAWTVFFAVDWWIYTPHDGRRVSNSPAQQALIEAYLGKHPTYTDEERIAAAEGIWHREKGQALTIIILGWLVKFYFAALLYSYAHHLRRNTYRSLPLSRPGAPPPSGPAYTPLAPDADAELDDAPYSPATPVLPLHAASGTGAQYAKMRSASAGSFADFVSAPIGPPPRRQRRQRQRGSLLSGKAVVGAEEVGTGTESGIDERSAGGASGSASGSGSAGSEDEVLFDEDVEAGRGSGEKETQVEGAERGVGTARGSGRAGGVSRRG